MQLSTLQKSLLNQLADGRFHSGAALARDLALSRTAIWSLVHELGDLGLDVSAIPGKGYRLGQPMELLDRDAIDAALSARARAALPLLELHDCIDSTSTRLGALAREGAACGSVCIAEAQTGGRGRIGRSWLSPFAGSLCLSLLWRFDDASSLTGLSLAVGVATERALSACGVRGIGLKWPNDLLWNDRKLGGILLEVSGEAHGRHAAVIGIGLNVQIPQQTGRAIDQAWTDLRTIAAGKPPGRNRLAAALLNELVDLLQSYPDKGLPAYVDQWNALHCMRGRRVVLQQGNTSVHGVAMGIDPLGLLVLRLENGEQKAFASGDVRVRLDAG